jgi:hypothetical protein
VRDGFAGRPGIDAWLQDLRSSLAQFTNSEGICIIVGQWSIDANTTLNEPAMYAGYLQAIFTASLVAQLWGMGASDTSNPVTAVIQYPMIGSSQEPFDPATGASRPAIEIYDLIHHYLGDTSMPISMGSGLSAPGLVAAASAPAGGQINVLLVNTDANHALDVHVSGLAGGVWRVHLLEPGGQNGTVQAHDETARGDSVTVPPWGIAVVQGTADHAPTAS